MAGLIKQQEYFAKVIVPAALTWARQQRPTFDYTPYFKASWNKKVVDKK